jgi:hypothetical protein
MPLDSIHAREFHVVLDEVLAQIIQIKKKITQALILHTGYTVKMQLFTDLLRLLRVISI